MARAAILALANGEVFRGIAIGADGSSSGEVVFNTAITGYQEILTDPSYANQIITLTHPHIGNTGVNEEDEESDRIWASGLVIRDLPLLASSWRKQSTLEEYLSSRQIVGIAEIDTRKLTRILREQGSQNGCLMSGAELDQAEEQEALAKARAFPGLKGMDLAREVSVAESYNWNEGGWSLAEGFNQSSNAKYHVVAYDFGTKRNILRLLVDRNCSLTVVPASTSAEEVIALHPDGVFLSNGPGDPDPCDYAIAAVQGILKTEIPVFGICLGLQILSLASGAKTKKMKHGHHGANHPVKNLADGTVLITSQNHGFCVDDESLPATMRVTHRSLFDGSLQGVCRTDKPAFGFQGHPEASPGPHDAAPLFDRFIELMEAYIADRDKSSA
ncbi:MAG: glutamine-hydrolyzing carbamoyl-phosphate synthase small subunit [Pseudomonadales bacterium]|nr:glutamine-hydrolyzing carbamoyl-phosphate synthase small subunit [Pseudomonadales bacterium]MDP7359587.1 glutamine-hydrolyzing carbamoyl-phosphate synthase small subunit [Pseudomonadales bacterium]MDP7595812.1 glutamine-hydrolyzing carbamoyl-phosphate synthase small subunit [Pseudomonadales bacterium]HJN49956.1 glutamine-hydrolyzing carbamoyl-phosphate synthase small subunit [Pseudomonadales bacterium]